MAFKKSQPPAIAPDSPEKVLLDLPRRTIPGVLLHQGEVMREYATRAVGAPDVALQLPTGSGKTLVGLMIAEWRRRKFRERVVYLCPTKQLVNQVVEQATDQYGLALNGFTGSASGYAPAAKAEYQNAERIAVTTYSSLFNVNPFFESPELIIVDDAHAAENYIASMWALRIERQNAEHKALHTAITGLLKPLLDVTALSRITGKWQGAELWVDKVASPAFAEVRDELIEIIDEHAPGTDLRFSWKMIRDHLHACHLYLSADEILIRPLIPPTWEHAPYANAKHRIFMSATLGAGGDLERLTGRKKILRLSVPQGWDRKGIGRRYFVFPEMSLEDKDCTVLRREIMRLGGRSLVLVPNDHSRQKIAQDVAANLGFPTLDADAIEASKKAFTSKPQAVAVVANRYDGIDFPGDDCRLLFIEGLPKATNLQERFLMSRMGAAVLFNERIQTRVLQAIGRCTRSLQDYSAVIVSGAELPDYLSDRRRLAFLHPEVQAEVDFGIEQSRKTTSADLLENVRILLAHAHEWEEADQQIVAKRQAATQNPFPAMEELASIVRYEIDYQEQMWQGDFEAALASAESVLGGLTAPELRGYRALWHYLAGSAAWLASNSKIPHLTAKARAHFTEAKNAARGIPWLVALSRFQPDEQLDEADDSPLFRQLERVEDVLVSLGTVHDRAFARREKEILKGLDSSEDFERAHLLLGQLIGFEAGKVESNGSPDPWWLADQVCFVFEDHAGAKGASVLDVTKARQAASHPKWVRANVPTAKDAEILPVLVTPVIEAADSVLPHLSDVLLWSLTEFREWATDAVATIRELRRTFSEPGNLFWRAEAAEVFKVRGLDFRMIAAMLKKRPAGIALKRKPAK